MTVPLRSLRWPVPVFALLWALSATRVSLAEDAPSMLLAAPTGYTDVADAFEPGDPLDVNVQLRYRHDVASGTIQREVLDASSHDGRTSHHRENVAEHTTVRNELALRLEAGLYHDLMLFVRVPIVLSDDSELRGSAGAGPMHVQPLFDLSSPLVSARRSGLPSFDFGLAWAVTNQYRMPHLATWVLIIESSANTGAVMQPCLEKQPGCEAGVSRGTSRLKLESRWSYRYRYVEPFMGVSHTFEWVTASGADVFWPAGELPGIVDDDPPELTDGTLGAAVIPWEERVRHQRFEIDVWGSARFISAGRDYSPLFDALGTSSNMALSMPNLDTPSGTSRKVRFTGLTNVQAHALLGLDTELVIQAARYVRFALGVGMSFLTSHLITGAPACDTAVKAAMNDSRAGSCADGIYNPVHRPAIDVPGQRFLLDGDVSVRFQASATAQF